ncbi:hypothetical protein FVD15_02930 [Campylobacter volucris]|uniref:Type II secretion system protein n=1 Tax=Campylobacter volucris TaxID=1031542 RepID=A0AAE5YGF8_9BACT|nr:hypothetical protein [Campylobacter volucris]AJC94238.1 hypothetical protein CVOL_0933 [Campylobacter volucris LMG 24379]KAB0580393.1 hypothetical protein F7P61_01945 [Campylobacter volucris]MBF7043101.1 hypothetical protein [Campylobacter volucris]MBF7043483.1 hypothetical protein [Campylobacter volucris]QBL13395.1 hypothetical protein A9460_03245 [Campylobacter volucris]
MKQAFSLLELAFCIVLLGVIFSFYYFIFYFKSFDSLKLNQKLYEVEKNLLQKNLANTRIIQINNHIFIEYFDDTFNLKSLKPKDLSYKKEFYNEASF